MDYTVSGGLMQLDVSTRIWLEAHLGADRQIGGL